MRHKNKITEVNLIPGTEYMNQTHLTSADDVAYIIIVCAIAAAVDIMALNTLPLNF